MIRDNNNSVCIFIDTKKNKQCTIKTSLCNEFKDYCGKHQTYGRYINEKDKGNKICRNWIRGCWNVLNNNKETCDICLEKNRKNDKKNYNKKKDNSEKYNKDNNNTNNRMCFLCNKIVDKSLFKKDKCFNCYESQQKHEKNCNRKMDDYDVKYKELKRECKEHRRNIELKLEKEDCIKLWDKNCVFCNTNENIGIDRINPELGYIIDNVQSCCYTCNIMKGNKFNNDKFMSAIKYILFYKKLIKDTPDINSKKIFECKSSISVYYKFTNECNNRNIKYEITNKEYDQLIKEKCYYCGNHENGAKGIDRKDSKIFYTRDNCISCCKTCNFIKNVLSEKEFLDNLLIIYRNYNKIKLNNVDLIYTKIDTHTHIIMNKNQEEYENLLYTKNIDNTKYDKIELEYIENEEQVNNWNYFVFHYNEHLRNKIIKNTESFNFFVKYKEKYIGMISVDKDNYANDTRDNYIKWSKDIKMKNFDNIIKLKFIKNFTDNDNFKTLFPTLLNSDYVKNIYKNKIGKNIYWISIYDNLKDYENNEKYTYIEDKTNANNKPMVCIKVKNIEKLCKETKNSKNSNVIINDSSSIKKLKKNNFIITI